MVDKLIDTNTVIYFGTLTVFGLPKSPQNFMYNKITPTVVIISILTVSFIYIYIFIYPFTLISVPFKCNKTSRLDGNVGSIAISKRTCNVTYAHYYISLWGAHSQIKYPTKARVVNSWHQRKSYKTRKTVIPLESQTVNTWMRITT